jgi:hypothetical protein
MSTNVVILNNKFAEKCKSIFLHQAYNKHFMASDFARTFDIKPDLVFVIDANGIDVEDHIALVAFVGRAIYIRPLGPFGTGVFSLFSRPNGF